MISVFAAALLNLGTHKSSLCAVACRYQGYDGGLHTEEKCLCYDERPYEETIQKKVLVLPGKVKPKTPAAQCSWE